MTFLNPVARSFPHKATYWAQQAQDGFGGENWLDPVLIDCRWESMSLEVLSVAYKAIGEETIDDSVVYTRVPLKEGGYLYLGESAATNPTTVKKAYVIRSTSVVPSLNGRISEYTSRL